MAQRDLAPHGILADYCYSNVTWGRMLRAWRFMEIYEQHGSFIAVGVLVTYITSRVVYACRIPH